MAGPAGGNEVAIMSLHPAALTMLTLVAVSRLPRIPTLAAVESEHAGELVGGV